VIYRAPKSNKDFLTEFSDFLSNLATKADDVLPLSDFNIHACCPQKALVREFTQLLDFIYFWSYAYAGPHLTLLWLQVFL